ncbi:hypothetical protein M9Y10_000989 [Tritrichomonas musculus]|uniref:Uncharacterized protein n=1 Tax=Tritrichomonas musculus TaxID=1915356 RepID=A0ABR2L7F2_9EUKA
MAYKDIIELSDLQYLLFDLDDETVESTYSAIIRSNYFENCEMQNILIENISLLIELRPNKIDQILDLCVLINQTDQTNSFLISLFKNLLSKLSQEHQFFIFKAYHCNIFAYDLIISSIKYLIDFHQRNKAYKLARWFSEEISSTNKDMFKQLSSFNFLNKSESEIFKKKKNNDFLLKRQSSTKLDTELQLYEILRNDNLKELQANIKQFSDILVKRKHFFSIDSIYSQFIESSTLLDEELSVFDICAFYNSIECFEYLYAFIESNDNDTNKCKLRYLQSISREKVKPFNVLHFAIAGGSIPIIFFLIEHQFPLDNCVQCSIYFHRNDLIDLFVAASPSKFLNPTAIVNSSADVWETPLFQSCHTNNVEVFLQMLNYNDIQSSLNLTLPTLPTSSPQFPNPFFYNLNLYLYVYDNIIKARDSIELGEEKKDKSCVFSFKTCREVESAFSSLFSAIKHTKEMLLFSLFYICKKGYTELLELYINEMVKISKSTEKILKERSSHEHDDVFQFPFYLNAVDQYENTLLIIASKYNQISCVKSLLNIKQILDELNENNEENSVNIDINLVNNEGRSALDYACFNCNVENVESLLSNGQINIENLHKGLISSLRSSSYYNKKVRDELQSKDYFYSLMFPSYIDYYSGETKIVKSNPCFEKVIGLILKELKQATKSSLPNSNDINGSIKNLLSLHFSMYHKTIEQYSIINDDLEIFSSLINTPEALKSLSGIRCAEIIKDVIKNNSINILKYIFGYLKSDEPDSDENDCPISVNKKFNFLKYALVSNKYDSANFLFSLNCFNLTYDDVFSALQFPDMLKLIYENKQKIIDSNINIVGKKGETLLTQAAIDKMVNSFHFLMCIPAVNINAKGAQYDPINESYRSECSEIFLCCVKHPSINMKLLSYVPERALEIAIREDDAIAAKLILEKSNEVDITEPIALAFNYSALTDYSYNRYDYIISQKKSYKTSLMKLATALKSNYVVDYFRHYLKINNIEYSEKLTKRSPTKTDYTNIEKAVIKNDLELFKKEVNAQNINVHSVRTGMTPLSIVIQRENIDMLKHLLSFSEIDVNLENKKPENPVYTSFGNDQKGFVPCSLGKEETPLIMAIETKNVQIVQLLLSMPSIDVNKFSGDKFDTPLMHAIRMNNRGWLITFDTKKEATASPSSDAEKKVSSPQAIVYSLLNSDDLDVNQCLPNNVYPILEAISNNQVDTIRRMVELYSDDSHNKKHKIDFSVKNFLGNTPLAASRDKPQIWDIIKDKCPDRDTITQSLPRTAGSGINWTSGGMNKNQKQRNKANSSNSELANIDFLKSLEKANPNISPTNNIQPFSDLPSKQNRMTYSGWGTQTSSDQILGFGFGQNATKGGENGLMASINNNFQKNGFGSNATKSGNDAFKEIVDNPFTKMKNPTSNNVFPSIAPPHPSPSSSSDSPASSTDIPNLFNNKEAFGNTNTFVNTPSPFNFSMPKSPASQSPSSAPPPKNNAFTLPADWGSLNDNAKNNNNDNSFGFNLNSPFYTNRTNNNSNFGSNANNPFSMNGTNNNNSNFGSNANNPFSMNETNNNNNNLCFNTNGPFFTNGTNNNNNKND